MGECSEKAAPFLNIVMRCSERVKKSEMVSGFVLFESAVSRACFGDVSESEGQRTPISVGLPSS
jgi:hypothetical protein